VEGRREVRPAHAEDIRTDSPTRARVGHRFVNALTAPLKTKIPAGRLPDALGLTTISFWLSVLLVAMSNMHSAMRKRYGRYYAGARTVWSLPLECDTNCPAWDRRESRWLDFLSRSYAP
jgi:hypothetical protein